MDVSLNFFISYLFGKENIFIYYCSPFPTVAEAIQEELEEYRASEDDVKRLKASMVRNVFCYCKNNRGDEISSKIIAKIIIITKTYYAQIHIRFF